MARFKIGVCEDSKHNKSGLPVVPNAVIKKQGGYCLCVIATPESTERMKLPDAPKASITQCNYCHVDVIISQTTPKELTPVCAKCITGIIKAIEALPITKPTCQN